MYEPTQVLFLSEWVVWAFERQSINIRVGGCTISCRTCGYWLPRLSISLYACVTCSIESVGKRERREQRRVRD